MSAVEIGISVLLEIARTMIIIMYFNIFYVVKNKKIHLLTGCLSIVITSGCYLMFNDGLLNIISTIIGMLVISASFEGKVNRKILLTAMCFALMCAIDLISPLIIISDYNYEKYRIMLSFISVFLFYVAVMLIKLFFKNKNKTEFSGQWYILLSVSIMSVCILYVMYLKIEMSVAEVIFVSTILMAVNFLLYVFYASMLDRFIYEQEVNTLKHQMIFYENQIRSNVENDKKIRSIRHDMKHHIREIRGMAENEDYEGIIDYTNNISKDISAGETLYNTGNIALDGILNYYAGKFLEKSIDFNLDIVVPENMDVEAYDINIILGNLFDNAIENSIRTEKPSVKGSLKYIGGVLHILIENSFDGELNRKDGILISRKSEEHGFGLENVKRIVRKYNGDIVISADNKLFSVGIVMYVQKKC
jgi:signal transduction histidine kinase